jgi:hypothetical protein
MRRGLCALAGFAALALSGCVGVTDPATHVTQTSAWLEAHGRSDDYPAKFYFRYANSEADLRTAAAHRTPTRTVPAHRPASGEYGYFHEGVFDLLPGRNYYYELCGADDRPGAQEACGGVQRFFTNPSSSQDSVHGTLYSGFGPYVNTYTFDAASGPQGQNADGWITVLYRGWYVLWEGRVTCLSVNGKRAAIGMVGQAKDGPDRPFSGLFTLTNDGPEPTLGVLEQSPPDCANATFDNQNTAYGGSLVITDVP